MEVGIIYVATNRLNGKCYVGQTWQPFRRRKNGHRQDAEKGSPRAFQRAIRKYGFAAFDWQVVGEAAQAKKRMSIAATGRKHTDETKQKCREAAKRQTNRVPPPLHTGMKRSEETKRRISEGIKRYYAKLKAAAA